MTCRYHPAAKLILSDEAIPAFIVSSYEHKTRRVARCSIEHCPFIAEVHDAEKRDKHLCCTCKQPMKTETMVTQQCRDCRKKYLARLAKRPWQMKSWGKK